MRTHQRDKKWIPQFGKIFPILFAAFLMNTAGNHLIAAGPADKVATASCNAFMTPKINVKGKQVGQEECLMQDVGIVEPSRKYHRVEMGISGTLSGWIVKGGRARLNHFTSMPDFLFTQFGNPSPRFHGILRYEAAKGNSLTLIYPETGWNGKFFVLVHGSGGSFRRGSMKAWDQIYNPTHPFADVTKYEKAMLDKGYAIARTRRNADRFVAGDYSAVLDTGETWSDLNVNLIPELILDEVRLVGNFLKERMGKKPLRNYWYGHSAGAYSGLALNYVQDANKESDGKNLIDGFIDDDPGGGLFVPVLMKNGQDVLLRNPDERAKFIKTIVIAHQMYPLAYTAEIPGEMDIKNVPTWVSTVALANKRTTARMMKEKGIDGNGYVMYEVKGVSHFGGETLPDGKDRDVEILDLSRLIDGVVDMLDYWVEKGISPPPTRSESAGIGVKSEAVNLPETACPLGQYYPYPSMRGVEGASSSGFAAFDGQSLEPLDGRVQTVDMNRNGKRDLRETMTQAWRRLGLLKPSESFNRAAYVACVEKSASSLLHDRFITEKVASQYTEEAQTKEFPSD